MEGIKVVMKAADFAALKHKNQKRKTGAPYINHPICVTRLLTDAGVTDPNTLAAALLHEYIPHLSPHI